jgi:hypothetical protein
MRGRTFMTSGRIVRTHEYALAYDLLPGPDNVFRKLPQRVQDFATRNNARLWKLAPCDGLSFHKERQV